MSLFEYPEFHRLSNEFRFVASADGFFTELSECWSSLLGYTTEALLSRPIRDILHPDDAQGVLELFTRLDNPNDVNRIFCRIKHNQGHYIPFDWSITHSNNTGQFLGIVREVSREQDLRSYLSQLSEALKKHTIYAETDINGVITEANDLFCQISGYNRDELIGKTHKVVNSGFHPDAFFKNMWTTISAGKMWTGTIKNLSKTGHIYYVQTFITPILDANNNITKYVAIRNDITSAIESSAALGRVNRVLNETGSIAKVGGWELDIASGELNWTDETFSILEVEKRKGQKPQLAEGLSLFTPEYQAIMDEAVNRCINEGKSYSLDVKALTAKGNVKWVFTNGRANWKEGKITSISGTIQDIDERKKNQQELQLARQKSFHNAKLASLGELAASMAHEINNPLGIISGNAELLQQFNKLDETQSKNIESILDATDRIAHIVKNLRRFSNTHEPEQHQKKAISTLINRSMSLAKTRLKTERVKLHFDCVKDAYIWCNEYEIEQVLLNLFNNAIDAVKGYKEKWIRIQCEHREGKLLISVIDAGKGIPPTEIDRIFEPFQTTKSADRNSGLGLSISREILNHHDGDIDYLLKDGHTCFTVTLPIAEGETE